MIYSDSLDLCYFRLFESEVWKIKYCLKLLGSSTESLFICDGCYVCSMIYVGVIDVYKIPNFVILIENVDKEEKKGKSFKQITMFVKQKKLIIITVYTRVDIKMVLNLK